MAKMSGTETTSFPKMGEGWISSAVNISGNRSPYTKAAPRKTEGRGASPTGKKVNRGASLIKEANGPKYIPVATIYYPNAPENQPTKPKFKTLPSAVGDKDFGSWRSYGPTGGM